MKTFKFEVTIEESDLEGDEFWESAVAEDGTGIKTLTQVLVEVIEERMFAPGTEGVSDMIKLVSFTDK